MYYLYIYIYIIAYYRYVWYMYTLYTWILIPIPFMNLQAAHWASFWLCLPFFVHHISYSACVPFTSLTKLFFLPQTWLKNTLLPIIMEVENGSLQYYDISFLSFRVVFHFHDYGRKGNSSGNSSAAVILLQVTKWLYYYIRNTWVHFIVHHYSQDRDQKQP